MNELEAVELRVSEVLEDNKLFRLEAEFFQKKYLDNYKKFKFNPRLSTYSKRILCGPFGSTILDETYKESGIKVIRPFNIKSLTIENDNIVFIDYTDIEEKNLKTFTKNTIFFSRVGDIKCGIYLDNEFVTISPNIIAVEIKEEYNPYFLTVFFNIKFGLLQIQRELKVSAQPTVSTERLQNLKLPLIDKKLQDKIGKLFKNSTNKIVKSEFCYKEAENILLKELDLLNFEPTQKNIAIKNLSESFLETGRLDSEYYQPKYDEIVEKIKDYKGGVEIISSACNLKDSNHKPTDDKYYQYIELSNIGRTGNITGFTYNLGKNLPSRARRMVKKNDVIISSIEGSLEKVALVTEEFSDSLCSTGFYIVNSNKINSETLLVLFKNRIMQQVLKQNCSGTILTGMNKDEFLNIHIPIIDMKIQIQIEEKVNESFKLKTESQNLLELAKRAVEVAIEEGEEVAIKILGEYDE